MITILFIGDVVGEPGRTAVKHMLPELKREHGADFIIVNGENAAAGRGITPRLAQELLHAGVDVITTGDHVWDQAELAPWMESEPRVLRPVNYPQGTPGHGSVVVETPKGKIAVMQVQGRSFIQPPLETPSSSRKRKPKDSGKKKACGLSLWTCTRKRPVKNLHRLQSGRPGFCRRRDTYPCADGG